MKVRLRCLNLSLCKLEAGRRVIVGVCIQLSDLALLSTEDMGSLLSYIACGRVVYERYTPLGFQLTSKHDPPLQRRFVS